MNAGWIPPWRQTSVAPRSQASRARRTISVVRDEIRRTAKVRRQPPLREGAEAAAEVADVRVLDVPRDDVADLVAADLAAEPVGGGEDTLALVAAGAEEAHELVLPQLVRRVHGQRVAGDDERDRAGLARMPAVLAREPERVRRAQRGGQHGRVDPLAGEVARVDGQPRRQLEPARARAGAGGRGRATAPRG